MLSEIALTTAGSRSTPALTSVWVKTGPTQLSHSNPIEDTDKVLLLFQSRIM